MLSGARYGAHTQENCLEPFVWIRILLRIIKMLLGGSQEGLITMFKSKVQPYQFQAWLTTQTLPLKPHKALPTSPELCPLHVVYCKIS